MKQLFLSAVLFFSCFAAIAEKHFICYDADNNAAMQISICFENEKATYVKYKGQDETISLKFVKRTISKGVANYSEVYTESYRGKVNGSYVLTHSGNYDYVKYTRKKDGKVFNFTINHTNTVSEQGNYRQTPCF